jgi:hypothetical protein
MTQLKRWLDDEIPEDIARMLRAGYAESPRKGALERTLTAFGATSFLLGTASSAVAATGKTLIGMSAVTAKWLTLGILGFGVATTSVVLVRNASTARHVEGRAALPAVTASMATELTDVGSTERQTPSGEAPRAQHSVASPQRDTLSVEPTTPQSTTTHGKRHGVVPSSAPTALANPDHDESAADVPSLDVQLGEEMRTIDRARTALRANNAALCLQILEEYRRTFARPRLAPEATYLRMQAALRMGDRAMATEVAREIVRRYPSSPHVGRAMELLQREADVPDSL